MRVSDLHKSNKNLNNVELSHGSVQPTSAQSKLQYPWDAHSLTLHRTGHTSLFVPFVSVPKWVKLSTTQKSVFKSSFRLPPMSTSFEGMLH